jgi:hypothetical protein
LSVWLRASRKEGLRVPWPFVRHVLGERYHVPPFTIDQWPAQEVALELKLLGLEGAAEAWRAQTGRR